MKKILIIVICGWQGKFDMTLGSGQQLKINKFGITFIFSKIDNQWKAIHQHSFALPPVQESIAGANPGFYFNYLARFAKPRQH